MNHLDADRVHTRRSRAVLVAASLSVLFAPACAGGTEPLRPVALGVTTRPPSTAQSGVALTTAPVVELRDRDGARFTQGNVMITVAIADGGGTLSGTTTRTTDNDGRATFFDLVITGSAGPRTLRFTGAGLAPATSSAIALSAGP